jgi:glucose-1-phosphate thymidylyltransferase
MALATLPSYEQGEIMRVVIPVAGSGTRLRPHTYSQPKPLLHVGNKPIIAHLLDPVVRLEPEEVIFVVGYMSERIREYVEANYSFKATFVPQDKLLGLGYAVDVALRAISGGDLLVLLGDTIVECDLGQFVRAGDNVLGVLPVDNPKRFGIVTVQDGRVISLEEKPENPQSNLAIIGLYYFKDVRPLKDVLQRHVESGRTTRGEVQFTDALQLMLESGSRFVPYEVSEWFDCGKKETMLSTNCHLVTLLVQKPVFPGSNIRGAVYIHPSARIVDSAIGPAVSISEGTAVLKSDIQNSIIGRNCHIENATLKDSFIGNDVRIKGVNLIANLGDSSEVESG